jgi:hypothetical protein
MQSLTRKIDETRYPQILFFRNSLPLPTIDPIPYNRITLVC